MTLTTCEFCRDRLSALLDRELGPEELDGVREHLTDCTDCRRELAQLCCEDAELSLPVVPAPPVGLWDRIEGRLSFAAPTPTLAPSESVEILTPEEAARLLRLTGEELAAELDHLPHFRIGPHLRFRKTSLEAWMFSQEAASRAMPEPVGEAKVASGGNVVDFVAVRARLSRYGRG